MIFFNKLFRKKELELDRNKLPVHIAIIPDGNGRWAQRRGLPRSAGHRAGTNTLRNVVRFCDKIGIKYLTVYTFSTENWKRPKNEVDALMSLLLEFLKNAENELRGTQVRIKTVGNIKGLSVELQNEIKRVESLTRHRTGLVLNIALNYGGKDEIICAVKNVVNDVNNGQLKPEDINMQTFSDRLYTAGMPDPDLLIRTSGEKRSSNFLLWQLAYTEFWYTDVLWPDFKEEHILEAVKDFQNRGRRFGGI